MKESAVQSEYLFDAMLRAAVCQAAQEQAEELQAAAAQERHRFSQEHNRKMRDIFRRHRWLDRLRQALPVARRAAVVALMISALSIGALMSSATVRKEVVRVVTQWFEQFTNVGFIHEDAGLPEQDTDLRKSGMMLPGYIPEGYTLTELDRSIGSVMAVYQSQDGLMITYDQLLHGDEDSISIDNEQHEIELVIINEMEGIFAFSNTDVTDTVFLIWNDASFTYMITGNVDKETVIAMAESLYSADF